MSKRKVTMTANQYADKWGRRLKAAQQDIVTGIEGVSESPMEKAAAQGDKMLQNLTAAVQDGRWQSSLKAVSLADWKRITVDKVKSRMQSGVDNGIPKMQKFGTYLTDTLNQVLPEIDAMPSLTLNDSLARVQKLMEHMHNNRYKR